MSDQLHDFNPSRVLFTVDAGLIQFAIEAGDEPPAFVMSMIVYSQVKRARQLAPLAAFTVNDEGTWLSCRRLIGDTGPTDDRIHQWLELLQEDIAAVLPAHTAPS